MRFPCENYLRFLLVGGHSRWTIRDIRTYIQRLGYPDPKSEYLLLLRNDLERTRPRPYDPDSREGRTWLRGQGLWPLSFPNMVADTSSEILGDPEARPALEALIISGIPMPHVQKYFSELRGIEFSLDVIEHYAHFYWNRPLLRMEEWLEFLSEYVDGSQLAVCYMADPEYALYHLGVRTEALDIREMVEESGRMSYFRLQETRLAPVGDVDAARNFKIYQDGLIRVYQEVRGSSALSQIMEQLRQFGLKFQDKEDKILNADIPEGNILDGTVSATPLLTDGVEETNGTPVAGR